MAQTALVYLIGLSGPRYVGRLDFELPLRVNGTNSFIHRKQRHVVHIDRIEPAYWSSNLASIPTVYVSAITGPPKPEPSREGTEDHPPAPVASDRKRCSVRRTRETHMAKLIVMREIDTEHSRRRTASGGR